MPALLAIPLVLFVVPLPERELAILLPGAAVGDAVNIAERVVCAVATSEAEAPVTLSAGVAGMKAGDSLESLLRRADDALYRAKIAGRNRVSC